MLFKEKLQSASSDNVEAGVNTEITISIMI
jgi:hypothetical protein